SHTMPRRLVYYLPPHLSSLFSFSFHTPSTSLIYTLSLHDALPIFTCFQKAPTLSIKACIFLFFLYLCYDISCYCNPFAFCKYPCLWYCYLVCYHYLVYISYSVYMVITCFAGSVYFYEFSILCKS